MKILPILACAVLLGSACRVPQLKSPTAAPAAKSSPTLRVVPLRHASASEVAAALQRAVSGGRIVADERTNSLIISCKSEAELAQVLSCIEQLDVEIQPEK